MPPPGPAVPPTKPPQPTEFPPAVKGTIEWLQARFARYYRNHPPPMPDRFTRREFGYILFPDRPGTPPFIRHKAYETADRFLWYLQKAGPHSVYYSTAYYRRPGEMKMLDKQWLGAELIFDLDADHLGEVEAAAALAKEGKGAALPLDEQLRLVKRQFIRLLDEFLFGDFGLGPDDVWITFSGGRGYHAHVVEPALMQLGSRERREIVDYITGKVPAGKGSDQPDLSPFIHEVAVGVEKFGKHVKPVTVERMAPIDAPGWQGRITRTLVDTLRSRVIEADPSDAKKWLSSLDGVSRDGAQKFLDAFTPQKLGRIGQGYIEQGRVVKRVVHHILQQATIPLAKGETDEPVTADTKRLIRLPGSLHGKSGLRVVTLRRDEVDSFDPLRDAVAFSMDPVKIIPRNDQEATLGGERVAVKKGEAVEVPEVHAVFWLARQAGTLASPSK